MRTYKKAAAALCGSAALVVCAAGSAAAHGDTIDFRISGQESGHVRTVASWDNDGDPVTERLAATLTAVSADGGHTLGPWRLVAVPGATSVFTTRETLPAGRWRIDVESGFPALGHGEATVTVPATAVPPRAPRSAAPATAPGTAVSAAPATEAAARHSGASPWPWAAAIGATVALGAACAAVFAALRRRRVTAASAVTP